MNDPNALLPGRRGAMALGAGLLLAGGRPARAITTADVPAPNFPLERGAKLRVLRPAKYIDPDEAIFNANTKRFTERTGIEVRVDYVNWPDMPVQVAVATNTGQGADVIIGFSADPHLYADKLLEVTDLADYLGAKYGGWYELAETYWPALEIQGLARPADGRHHRAGGLPQVLGEGGRGSRRSPTTSANSSSLPGAEADRPSLRLRAVPRAGRRAGLCQLAAVVAWRIAGG